MHITYLAFVEIDVANACVVHTREMCEQFIALEHEVTLILPLPLTMQSWQGIRHIWVRWWGFDRPRQWVFFLESAWRLWHVHRRRPIKVLYVREMDRHPFLHRFVKWLGIPMFVEVNGWALDELRHLGVSPQQSDAVERCQRNLFTAARGIIVSTRGNAEKVIAHYGISSHKVQIQELGTNIEHFQPGDKLLARQKIGVPINKPIIFFAGSFHPHHDLVTLLNAHAKLVSQGFEAFLLLVGDGMQRKAIQQQMDILGLTPCMRLSGACPYEKVPDYFQAADIGVVPLTADNVRQRQGAITAKLWDYMASRLPVVVTDLPNTTSSELLKDKAYVVPPGDENAMAMALKDILENSQMRDNIAAKGYDYVCSHRTWRQAAIDTVAFIEKRLAEQS